MFSYEIFNFRQMTEVGQVARAITTTLPRPLKFFQHSRKFSLMFFYANFALARRKLDNTREILEVSPPTANFWFILIILKEISRVPHYYLPVPLPLQQSSTLPEISKFLWVNSFEYLDHHLKPENLSAFRKSPKRPQRENE